MNIRLENVLTVIGIATGVSTVLAWWIGKFLKDKESEITNRMEISGLKEKFIDMQREIHDLKAEINELKDHNRGISRA